MPSDAQKIVKEDQESCSDYYSNDVGFDGLCGRAAARWNFYRIAFAATASPAATTPFQRGLHFVNSGGVPARQRAAGSRTPTRR
jgi:hypothetical protein